MAIEAAQPLTDMPFVNFYKEFVKSEGIPVYTGFAIEDLKSLELGQWARKGGRGAYINLDGTGGTNDAFVTEIPAGGALNVERHMFEELVYVLDGRGSTSTWYSEDKKISFEWSAGSVFSIPLNAYFQHFNGEGSQPARLFSVSSGPLIISLFHNLKFVFDNPFVFDDRFSGQGDFFSATGKRYNDCVLETNFVPDTHNMELYPNPGRGRDNLGVMFEIADNTMCAHISEFPVGTYKKAHRHGPGAHVIILSGQGYSQLWPVGGEKKYVPWGPGSVLVPPDGWFHQHFNGGATRARYLALRWGSRKYNTGGALTPDAHLTDVDVNQGGLQIEYDGEDPSVHQLFESHLAKAGATCRMRRTSKGCTGPESAAA
ncbi:MAG TPA: ethanolamine ammonia lyase-activating protein [Chloroflexota bacterium]|nr:ethanolamine ammonia lyase-activating protein [Chloroflexota bacterium]